MRTKEAEMSVDGNTWDVCYYEWEKRLIEVEVALRRPNRKWYQSKHLYKDHSFVSTLQEAKEATTYLFDKYRKRKQEEEELDEFFKKK